MIRGILNIVLENFKDFMYTVVKTVEITAGGCPASDRFGVVGSRMGLSVLAVVAVPVLVAATGR